MILKPFTRVETGPAPETLRIYDDFHCWQRYLWNGYTWFIKKTGDGVTYHGTKLIFKGDIRQNLTCIGLVNQGANQEKAACLNRR